MIKNNNVLGLKQKILLSTIAPILFILAIISGLAIYNKYNDEQKVLFNRFDSYIFLLESGNLGFDTIENKTKLESLLGEKVILAEIIKSDGSVAFSSENSSNPLIQEEEKKDLVSAFNGVATIKKTKYEGEAVFLAVSPLIINNKVVAVLHQVISTVELTSKVKDYSLYILLLVLAGLLICYLIIFVLVNRVVLVNIYKLEEQAKNIGKGNLNEDMGIKSHDEIGSLASSFNQMAKELQKNKLEMEGYNKKLEEEVAKKTVDLQSHMEELQRVNTFMVDRELIMIELKKRVAELESKNA